MTFAEDMTAEERGEVESMLMYMTAANEALKGVPNGVEVEFTCPLCGGTAIARRNTYNGHRFTKCRDCGYTIME